MPNGDRIIRQCSASGGASMPRCVNLATHLLVLHSKRGTSVQARCEAHRVSERFNVPLGFPITKRAGIVARKTEAVDA